MRTKTLGVVFLALILGAVWATHGVFTQKFSSYDEVTVHASRIGLQLPHRADVKIKGVIVGEVLDYEPTTEGADITLGLYEDRTADIPRDVTASILPKTLFGEKFVSLDVPAGGSSARPIADGDVIARTDLSIEVEQVLSDLYPLLRAVQPADLNTTLNAVATALEGRGEQVGETIETLDGYLTRLNPELPALVEDLRLTAKVSDTYADVLPEVATILRKTIVTTSTLEDREEKLKALFVDVSELAAVAERFTRANGDNLVRLGDLAAAQLEVFARYAPGYPCLLGGIVGAGNRQAEAFRGFTLHIVLETIPNQPRGYTAADAPVYGDKRGYYCGRLPNPPWSQSNPVDHQPDFVDGIDEPTGKGTSRVGPGWSGTAAGFAGGRDESALLKGLLAPGLGVSADDVPDLGVLLVGPMARGAEVSLR
ncbi:phospholipid/cholesterol/gamma-HCH transport system substrate-binding protein [Nocardioides cavernae]|uniref:Phospholipid/cholesterol/gamma-HCH transport system substrate-binding protein n=1 Tax=Nocardioides cavernae TaxID=1921566 RepID=A0A7Y9H315_9ACTN|nr:MCE family protein [Nocardioides cavernae]NYE37024.1 phospholipid/cholesterol/gamma-HCH transport system substrate-binding protein [Nocardioides cavernae]